MNFHSILCFDFILWLFITNFTCAIEVEKELTLTAHEGQLLKSLKMRLKQLDTQDWMKSDLSLIRWLRTKNLNLNEAEEAFKSNIKWRQENSIDSILDEDWSVYKEEFFFDDGNSYDYTGRPVISADISEWDVRGAVISGKGNKLLRYMIRGIESAAREVRSLQRSGHNITQWQVLLNMDNFNLIEHGCLQCLPIYLQFINAHESYYPFGQDKIIIINTPAAFEVVLRLVRPIMSPAMRDSLIVLGTNKAEWMKTVLSIIPADQLGKQFGGSKSTY